MQNAVYGLCELYKEEIKSKFSGKSRLLYHLFYLKSLSAFKEKIIDFSSVIIDAKSGVSGAGRSAKVENLFVKLMKISKLII